MVQAFLRFPRTSEGNIVDTWESEILCSNPRASKTPSSPVADKPSKNDAPASSASSNPQGTSYVPVNDNDPDDIAK